MVENTSLTSVKIFAGQQITVVPSDPDNFGYWIINNTQIVETAEYVVSTDENKNIVAVNSSDETEYTVTVTGGNIGGDNSATVAIGTKITLSVTSPEEGKTYGWFINVGGKDVMVLKGNNVEFYPTEDIAFTVYALKLAAPVNDTNQMFDYESATTIIVDRMKEADGTTRKTAFADNVDYVKFFIYTSNEEGAEPVGYMILDRNGAGGTCRFATKEGVTLMTLKGSLGNLYLDGTSKSAVQQMFKTVIGEDAYESAEHLYVAAQACSNNSEYEASDVSQIGTVDFKA